MNRRLISMANDTIVLSDEELANVTGGSRTNILQLAANVTNQANLVNGATDVLVLGGGKRSATGVGVQGSTNNVGNTALSLNSFSI
jgi:bacteriocin-like protein